MVNLIFALTLATGPHGWTFKNVEVNNIDVNELQWLMTQTEQMTGRKLPDGYTVDFRPNTWWPHDPIVNSYYGDVRVFGLTSPKEHLIEVATRDAYSSAEAPTSCAGRTAFAHELLHLLYGDPLHANRAVFKSVYSYEFRLMGLGTRHCALTHKH